MDGEGKMPENGVNAEALKAKLGERFLSALQKAGVPLNQLDWLADSAEADPFFADCAATVFLGMLDSKRCSDGMLNGPLVTLPEKKGARLFSR